MIDEKVRKFIKSKSKIAVVDQDGREYKRFDTMDECCREMHFSERMAWGVLGREFKIADGRDINKFHEQYYHSIHGWQLYFVDEFPDGRYPTMQDYVTKIKKVEEWWNNKPNKFDDLINENLKNIENEIMKLEPKIKYENPEIDLEFNVELKMNKPKMKEDEHKIVYYSPQIKDADELESKALW